MICALLNSIKIPPSIKFIGNKALRGLTWTDEIKIPEGVEQIGYDAFEAMHYVYLPASLMEIAPDFYYEECIDDPNYPPYIEVHPDNKVFFLKMEVCISKKRGLLLLIVNIMVLINTV